VGDEAILTVQVSLTHNGRPFTVKRSFAYTRVPPFPSPSGWSRGDFHIHTVFSDSGNIIVGRLSPYSVMDAADAAKTAAANYLEAIIITDHDDIACKNLDPALFMHPR
jgi:hypothetical protein